MTITLVDPIVLYENHKDDPSILALLYAKLCSRDQPLTMEQSVCLGIETTVRIFHARERLRSSSLNGLKSPLPNSVDLADVKQVIDEVWGSDTNGASGGWVIVNVFWCTFTYSFSVITHRIECRYSARQQQSTDRPWIWTYSNSRSIDA